MRDMGSGAGVRGRRARQRTGPHHCPVPVRQVFSPHAVALSVRASVPAHPGPDGRGVRGAVPADLPADGRRRRAVRVPLLGGHPAADPQHARGRGVRGGRAADRHPDLRRRSQRHGGGGRAHHRALPAGVHRHQLRLPGEEGGAAERRLGLPARPRPGRADHPRGHRRHPSAGHGEDPERLERRAARPGRHRAADAGRRARARSRCTRAPAPRCSPARPTGTRSRGWSRRWTFRSSATATSRPREDIVRMRRPHRLRRHHDRARRLRQSVALPRRAGAARRASRCRRARRRGAISRWRWSTPGWRSGSRATPARP